MNDIEIAKEEGRNNRTVIFAYYSKQDNAIVSREGFPYEVKNEILFYFDYQKKDLRRITLQNLKSVTKTGNLNTEAPYPCKL
jgi:hypothetical protein